MFALRPLLAASAVVVLGLVLSACGGSDDSVKVLFPGDCQKATYKPTQIVMTCADANTSVTGIAWKSYGEKTAAGSGTVNFNACVPSCVAGKVQKAPAAVALSKPKDCGSDQQFTVATVVAKGAKIAGASSKLTQTFPCARD